jgi:hypothetical protein
MGETLTNSLNNNSFLFSKQDTSNDRLEINSNIKTIQCFSFQSIESAVRWC